MKGKATTEHNYTEVEWQNGFRSRMPDWPTARECGASYDMLGALLNCRTLLFNLNTPGNFFKVGDRECVAIDHAKLDTVFEAVQLAIEKATGMESTPTTVAPVQSIFLSKPFPPPPGFK